MKLTVKTANNYIVDIIIVLECILIGLSYYLPIDSTKYLLFILVGLSLLLGLINIPISFRDFPRVSITQLLYLTLVAGSIIYTGFIRNSFPIAIVFISSVTFMLLMYFNGLSRRNILLLITCSSLLTLVHIINLGFIDQVLFRQIMTATFQNPNMAGIVISSTIMILIAGFYFVNNPIHKTIIIILSFASIFQLFLTANRGSIISIIVLILLLILHKKKGQISKYLSSIFLVFPVLFPLLYTGIMSRLPEESEFLGKPLFSGREMEWASLISFIKESPFSISNLPVGGLNIFLVGLIVFGIVGFTSYIVLLFIMKPNYESNNRLGFKQAAYIAFLCVFIQQTFESTLILGSYGVYILSYLLLGMAFSKDEVEYISRVQD